MDTLERNAGQILSAFDPNLLAYYETRFLTYKNVYHYIFSYAKEHQYTNTLISLALVRGLLLGDRAIKNFKYKDDGVDRNIYFNHCLNTAKALIDLHPQLTKQENDVMLSAALLHVLLEKIDFENQGNEIVELFEIDYEVLNIIRINLRNHKSTINEDKLYYQRIQNHKLALLVKLADRGNIVEQIYAGTPLKTQNYIRDTKQNFLPMCIYGKEHYPELARVINVQMGKMRSLIDATEIITNKHLERVALLNNEILELEEDNARIRMMIKKLEEESLK